MRINLAVCRSWLAIAFILFCTSNLALADGRPFDPDHGRPYDFEFGNHFDTHQQSRMLRNGTLSGFLYVTDSGEDPIEGIPVLEHCDENTDPAQCHVGWSFSAKPGRADFVFHDMDHPLWLVERGDIPQPGAFAHFHWLGGPNKAGGLDETANMMQVGYFIQLRALRKFYFKHGKETVLVRPGIDIATHVNLVSSFPATTNGGTGGH
jgi:hypothetical protein